MTPTRLRSTPGTLAFIAQASAFNVLLYHAPLFLFAAHNLDLGSAGGVLTLASLVLALWSVTALALTLLALASHRVLPAFCMLIAIGNAVALYFVVTYGVVLDKTMIGNARNTNVAEALELFHPKLLAYFALLGIVPTLLLARVRIRPTPRLRVAGAGLAVVIVTVAWAYLASGTWLWFDHNAKKLGGLAMPWSYLVNGTRHEMARWRRAAPIALPPASFASDDRTVVMLVIGEAARMRNFQLYGYDRPTNPSLSKAGVIALRGASACSTYTSASLRCILSHVDSSSEFGRRYEPLTSYLQRHGVDVVWRTRNWGEPPMQVNAFERGRDLKKDCAGEGCDHDEVLLHGLGERIGATTKSRVFVVLHQMGSHGPAYHLRYPARFERFTPVCKSVELSQCSNEELVNAYDNTILYTDHVLAQAIALLRGLDRPSLLIYVSDHGESLGEYGLYLHGTPYSIAPDVQKEVPLILWMSPEFMRQRSVDATRLQAQPRHSQRDIFHTVMGAFAMRSEAYAPQYDVFSETFEEPHTRGKP